jgi:hypothetical protein
MDKEALVDEVKRVLASFSAEGKHFDLVELETVFPGDRFILHVSADWLDSLGSTGAIDVMVSRLFELLSPTTLRFLNRVHVISRKAELENWVGEPAFMRGAILVA